jgi:hypothetical protein
MKRAVVLLPLLAGCVEHLPGIEGTQSLFVQLIGPADPGTPEQPLPDDTRTITVKVTALDEDNAVDATFSGDVDVHVQFLGGLTPELGSPPLERITLVEGESAEVDIDLPPVFGPTFLWIEDGGEGATYATGTSDTLWYRDPYVRDVSTPEDETALDALESSPLELKQVNVTASQYGPSGRLVVTGVYAQGYTVSDSQCADDSGTPPCVTGNYDHVLIFTFSRPRDERGRSLAVGQFIDGFTGAVQEFNGLTEIGFPQTFVAADEPVVDPAAVPAPSVIQEAWLSDEIEMERRESSLVAVENGTLCPLDDDYATYKQWKLDIGRGCGSPINVITAGVVDVDVFDPAEHVEAVIPRVVGTLRPVNIGTFNVWIMYPRDSADVTPP